VNLLGDVLWFIEAHDRSYELLGMVIVLAMQERGDDGVVCPLK